MGQYFTTLLTSSLAKHSLCTMISCGSIIAEARMWRLYLGEKMQFSDVRLDYSLFAHTNKITKIANKNKMSIFFLTTQLRTKMKLSLNIRLQITQYAPPPPLLKTWVQLKPFDTQNILVYIGTSHWTKFSLPPLYSRNWLAEHTTRGWRNLQTLA
jgi:hypothetical protein